MVLGPVVLVKLKVFIKCAASLAVLVDKKNFFGFFIFFVKKELKVFLASAIFLSSFSSY